MNILQHSPGQNVTLILEIKNDTNQRADASVIPKVARIIMNDLESLADGYPQNFTKLTTGLYYFTFTLPSGNAAVGTYIVDYNYGKPEDINTTIENITQIVVTAPLGRYSVSAG